ncbi:hypothetical protein BST97_01760 [Nonlabens spongiae]|uniref:DUF4349 domain-containing protein n=1 Tax=Nonlabens spongiae TaxID=331648 RepID=A0A1W6MGV3_9FLAO|nr:DUF4349 domain-containing protein [Nonlabens spongiae]ARN76825.1 hypothetical protein BST97_01760 [Nonlabens spongiae]
MKSYGLLLIVLISLLSCEADRDNFSESFAVANQATPASNYNVEKPQAPANRKIIWNANLEFQVDDVDDATQNISQLCSKYGAFISHMDLTSSNYEVMNRITIRVDDKNFNKLINDIKGTSTFMRRFEIRSNDVTEEFVDVESRLKTKKEVRERYIDILRNRSGEIKDVIAAEDAIRKITEEIEAKEGRLRYLQDQVSQSTINLEIYQKVDFTEEPETFEKGFFTELKESLQVGWEIVIEIFLLLVKVWPLILIAIGLLMWRRKWLRRKKSK